MAKAAQKITLSPSRDIPFNKLVLSQSNVRRVKSGISIEQLAESIAQRTLLQSLNVRAVLDDDGNETGMFEVPAGGRRYRALELLVKQKRMAKTQAVPCVVREGGIAEDDSIAENNERVGLHPLDQFRAFQTLRNLGMSEEDIAARHFVLPAIVKQRLRLASVAPSLLDVYADDGMTLEQLMAFTVSSDHARQEQVWENVSKSGHDEPYQIRRMLTESTVCASDKRARFVGVEAYEAAGGTVLRDLFERDDGGWLQDVPLLDRLVTEKLKTEAETIAVEGWKWIAVGIALRTCLSAANKQCFVMVAGAGSGKTTSLVKALASIIDLHGAQLQKRRQRVACITYTEIAAEEIWADVGNHPLVHVSTIHSFMWMIVRQFQEDVREWVCGRIDEKLEELRAKAASFGARVQQRTREKTRRDIERYEGERGLIASVKSFSYGTGSDYTRGVLGHDDIIRMSTQFLAERKLFRSLLAQQFPYLFVDESQDTVDTVVQALKSVAEQMTSQFCLGFFGDPMQRIYMTGIGPISPENGWTTITKSENFRCPTSVLALANAIRQEDDRLEQTRGKVKVTDSTSEPVVGTARMFILSADDRRDEQCHCRPRLDRQSQ